MNPVINPFAPGAGTPPPELAGRDELIEMIRISTERVRLTLPTKSILMVGLRGVGKTVLLDRMRDMAEGSGIHTLRIEAPEGRSLPAIIAPQLRQSLLRLSTNEKAKAFSMRALKALVGFAKSLKVKYNDIEVGFDAEPEPGLADSGDLEFDLTSLLETVGQAAKAADTAVIMFIDELQYVKETELASLIAALHRMSQSRLPVSLVGAGLPQLRSRMGKAKSYAERLFDFPEIGPLNPEAARTAIEKPLLANGVGIEATALDQIVQLSHCYPYFIQEWGKHTWDTANASPITLNDVKRASALAVGALDESFFRVRLDRLTPNEKLYMRAMAELGAGPHRSGAISEILKREVTALAPMRNSLITKGMIWSPSHGDTAFTVPLFDEFMRRIMPGNDWLSI